VFHWVWNPFFFLDQGIGSHWLKNSHSKNKRNG
jgi:hypothetical protein